MKKYIYLFQALLFSVSAFCTDLSRIKFEYLTVDDGLSQGTIEDILQDRQGMMWFATRDGLDRYDGQKFTIFRNNSNDPNSLASNWVLSLAIDPDGKLWIGSGGLNVYDPILDKLIRIPVNIKDANAFHGGQVYDINVDSDSTLWISTTNGLVHYFPRKHIFTTYSHDPKKASSLPVNIIYNTLVTIDQRLFVAGDTDPVFEFNRKDESFIPINYKKNYQGANTRKSIQEDQADDSDPTQVTLIATGEFSFSSRQERKFVINSGEGYVGTCYKEMKTLTIDNLPDDYVILKSGLGEISLHHVVLVPLVQDNVCMGVMEIASIGKMQEHKIRFIEKIAESLASVVTIIKANEKSNMMLEQNNIQAEELHAQEEEMRQNLEELMATQETSQKQVKELEEELRLKTSELIALQEEYKILKAKKAGA